MLKSQFSTEKSQFSTELSLELRKLSLVLRNVSLVLRKWVRVQGEAHLAEVVNPMSQSALENDRV